VNAPIVLDSFALVSLFHREAGWEKTRDVLYQLDDRDGKAILNIINWGEFYYIVRRRVGMRKAEEALALLDQLPIETVSVDDLLVREAAEIKSDRSVSYADAFCIATAQRIGGQILTNDPEYESVQDLVSVLWLTPR
jgi:predicted nucleic acid-binding protein